MIDDLNAPRVGMQYAELLAVRKRCEAELLAQAAARAQCPLTRQQLEARARLAAMDAERMQPGRATR